MPKEPKGRDRRLETQEESKLLEALKKTIVGDMVRFALETAMRRSEIVHMQWKDVPLTRRTVHIPETKTETPRTIPLNSEACNIPKQRRVVHQLGLVFLDVKLQSTGKQLTNFRC
ncbi:MAG: site-specific integrase [Candidatus Thiodiazotropha sp. (ex Lucinoma borealis)]|nr:site-specific integrase [Candidatus Thiodiazotropha sp. (ex Lucinoma borealis)]